MAFYLESQYLDLKKSYQNFAYESLTEVGKVVHEAIETYHEPSKAAGEEEGNPYEGISQNTYLFVQEKGVLQQDIANLCVFFSQRFIERTEGLSEELLKKFPFTKIKDRVCYIIQKYQEQPVLLDPLMESLIVPIMRQVRAFLKKVMRKNYDAKQQKQQEGESQDQIPQEFHDIVSVVYILCKVRHHKYINKFFPHEVEDLEPVVCYLIEQRKMQLAIWETKYVLLLWMSIIVLVPFDLVTIDSRYIRMESVGVEDKDRGQESEDLVTNLIEVGKYYLRSSSKPREASAVFLSNFFSRPDIQKLQTLKTYINWCVQTVALLAGNPVHSAFQSGIFLSLVEIFKIGQRRELLQLIDPVLALITRKIEKNEHTTVRHLKVKLAQRIGMTYLRLRAVTWAYRRGNKSLLENVKKTITDSKLKTNVEKVAAKRQLGGGGATAQKSSEGDSEAVAEGNVDYFKDIDLEKLEDLIDFLIENLRDKDTVVRWSAAKGLGRVTGRLDLDMADDVVSSVLELFSPNESEATWHGGCLTIGELSRRGLLLPTRLEEVFPIIHRALHYDVNQGNYSVGANVRDSACYIAWAFARAYDPEVLQPHVNELSRNLLITCIYDREVNCRRAASAAFQEHVGRQGSFQHGIQILTEADYFTLGLRTNAFLNVGPYVASYPVYYGAFIEHLAFVKLRNWDQDMRRLAAAALALMTCLNPQFLVVEILPGLTALCFNENVNVRHGALYGIAEILIGLCGQGHLNCMKDEMKDSVFLKTVSKNERKLMNAGEYMTAFKAQYEQLRVRNNIQLLEAQNGDEQQQQVQRDILEIVEQIEKQRLFRGKGGEVMRTAVCRLIECIAIARLPLKASHIKRYTLTLEECLKSFIEGIQTAAARALAEFSRAYHTEARRKDWTTFAQQLLKSASTDANVAVTRGYTRALTSLNKNVLREFLPDILKVLEENCKIKSLVAATKEQDDADTRKLAVKGLDSLVQTLQLQDGALQQVHFDKIFELLLSVMKDYTMDKRGDIGSIVREASMVAQANILRLYAKTPDRQLTISSELILKIVQTMLQQLSEKIDRVRLVAGSVLQEIFDKLLPNLPNFAHRERLFKIFCRENICEVVRGDQDRFDSTFETEVIKAELTYFILEDASRESDDYIYYWNQPNATYPLIVPLLDCAEYSYQLLKGLCVSIGGISESVIKFSSSQMSEYITKIGKREDKDVLIRRLFDDALAILEEHAKDERIVVPMFKTFDFIIEKQEIQDWAESLTYMRKLHDAIVKETKGTKSIMKLTAAAGLIVGMITIAKGDLQNDIFLLVADQLSHKFPKVRKLIADKFYVLLMTNGEEQFGDSKLEALTNFITDNEWLDERLNIKQVKEEFFKLLSLTEKNEKVAAAEKQKTTGQKTVGEVGSKGDQNTDEI